VSFNISIQGQPDRIGGAQVSANFFQLMGVVPFKGRSFSPEEDQPNSNQVVVLSHAFWQERFNGDPELIGKTLALDGRGYQVIGIMPKGFEFPRANELPPFMTLPPRTQLWTPIALDGEALRNFRNNRFATVARLKANVSLAQAQAELSVIDRQLDQQEPRRKGWSSVVRPLREQIVGSIKTQLWALFGAVGLVLLISCANVAHLLLARAAARQQEFAVRVALGATRGRLVRQLLIESSMLALLGGALGGLLALWGVEGILKLAPPTMPRLEAISLNGLALGFTVTISMISGVIFGLSPALQHSRPDLNESLKDAGKGNTAGLGQNRQRGLLVIGEVALSLALLIGAGLLLKSFVGLLKVDPGFDAGNLLTLKVSLPETKYDSEAKQAAFYRQMLEQVAALPGVRQVGAVSDLPLGGAEEVVRFYVEGRPLPERGQAPQADLRSASADYFRVMGIHLLKGRSFSNQDDQRTGGVAIISETLANRFWPDADPLGRRINWGDPNNEKDWLTIIGVVADVKSSSLQLAPRPQLYLSHLQSPWGRATLVVKTDANPMDVAAAARQKIWDIDRDQPVTEIRLMQDYVTASIAPQRFVLLLLGLFAGVAVLLASLGIYGCLTYTVEQRTREIGIRLALGAQTADVLKMIIMEGMKLALAGVGIGLAAAFGLMRLIKSLLFGVSATDPLTFGGVSLLLAAVALLACYVPARRATKVDPMVALRCE
jgi:putative ABC transport system permease protein